MTDARAATVDLSVLVSIPAPSVQVATVAFMVLAPAAPIALHQGWGIPA